MTLISVSDEDYGGIWKTIGTWGVIQTFYRHKASLNKMRARAFRGLFQGLSRKSPCRSTKWNTCTVMPFMEIMAPIVYGLRVLLSPNNDLCHAESLCRKGDVNLIHVDLFQIPLVNSWLVGIRAWKSYSICDLLLRSEFELNEICCNNYRATC